MRQRTEFVTNRRLRACRAIIELQTISQRTEEDGPLGAVDVQRRFEEVDGFENRDVKGDHGEDDRRGEGDEEAGRRWAEDHGWLSVVVSDDGREGKEGGGRRQRRRWRRWMEAPLYSDLTCLRSIPIRQPHCP